MPYFYTVILNNVNAGSTQFIDTDRSQNHDHLPPKKELDILGYNDLD